MLGLEALPAIIYFIALFAVPKSPRWLVMNGKEEEALQIMRKTNGEEYAGYDVDS